MSRTASVPTIQCHSYHPYHDRRRSGHPESLSGKSRYVEVPVHGTDRLDLKVQLRNCLNSCKLTSMPLGFPFHTVRDSHGYSSISHESFEFREDLSGPSHRSNSRHQYATITFKNASSRDKTRYLTWQAHISADTPYLRNTHSKQTAAHVQVDPAVSQTPFWISLINDPSVIMRALALSLELGALLTIQLADSRSCDAVVYTVTHKDGRQEPYFIVRT